MKVQQINNFIMQFIQRINAQSGICYFTGLIQVLRHIRTYKISFYKQSTTMSYYRFPVSLDGFRMVQSARQFQTRLAEAAKNSGFSNILYIQVTSKNPQGHLYFRCIFCRDCRWSMKYQRVKKQSSNCFETEFQPNSPYQLSRFNIYHYHTNYRLQDILDKGRRLERVSQKDGNEELIMSLAQMQYSHNQTCGYVSYLTGLSFLTARFIFYTCQTRRLVADFDDDFHQWYQTYKQKNLQIITFPPISNIFYLPDMIFITCQATMDLYLQKGHITGIKIIDNKVKQLSSTFQKYICIAFYGYLGQELHALFGFAILTVGALMDVEIDVNKYGMYENMNGNGMNEESNKNKKKIKIYSNLFKVLQVFLSVMGDTMQTILVQDKQKIINAAEYFISTQNLKRPPNKKISLIIDPMDTIHRTMPKHMRSLLISLIRSDTEEQWQRKFQQRIINNNQLSMQDIEIAKQFYSNKHRFLMYNHKEPKFVGRWFDHLHHFSYQYIDSRAVCKRSILFLLVYVSNTFVFLKKMYDRKFVSMVDHMTVEGILDFQILKEVRLGMYKDGFRLLCQQVFKANMINCVSSDAVKKQNKQIIAKLDKIDKVDDRQCEISMPNAPSASGLNSSIKNGSQFSACISQMQKPLSQYYKEMIKYDPNAIGQKEQKKAKGEQNSSKFQEDSDQKMLMKNQQADQQVRQPPQKPSKPLVNIYFARYEQLYPLRPATTISLKEPPPQFCIYEDHNKYYTCELQTITPQIRYKCTCNYLIFRGLPCRHIVKTCMLYSLPIRNYISDYWKLKKPYNEWKEEIWICKGMELPKRGRPKKSARNRMRNR